MPQGWRPNHPGDPTPRWSQIGCLVIAATVIAGVLIGLAIRTAGATDDGSVEGASPTTVPSLLDGSQRVEMPSMGFVMTLPRDWQDDGQDIESLHDGPSRVLLNPWLTSRILDDPAEGASTTAM